MVQLDLDNLGFIKSVAHGVDLTTTPPDYRPLPLVMPVVPGTSITTLFDALVGVPAGAGPAPTPPTAIVGPFEVQTNNLHQVAFYFDNLGPNLLTGYTIGWTSEPGFTGVLISGGDKAFAPPIGIGIGQAGYLDNTTLGQNTWTQVTPPICGSLGLGLAAAVAGATIVRVVVKGWSG